MQSAGTAVWRSFVRYIGTESSNSSMKPVRIVHNSETMTYVQGQEGQLGKATREYFYYIDHHGMLFMDDSRMKNFTSCFKDVKFLKFFLSRVKMNRTGLYESFFPYVSPCGREMNYIRCNDLPVVLTHVVKKDGNDCLTWGYCGDHFSVPFQPSKLVMDEKNGRIYHPCDEKLCGVGLVRDKLALELHSLFVQGDDGRPAFIWNSQKVPLQNDEMIVLLRKPRIRWNHVDSTYY